MKGYLPVYCLLAMMLAVPLTRGDDEVLTLERAIEQMLDFNRSLLSSRLQTGNTRQRLRQAQSAFAINARPAGRANADDRVQDLSYGVDLSKRLAMGTNLGAGMRYGWLDGDEGIEQRQTGRVRFEVSQPLFRNAGTLVNLEPVVAGALRVQAAERLFEIRKSDLVLETSEQFHAVKILERRLQIDQLSVERLRGLSKLTAARERQGGGSRVDALRVELQLGRADARLENTREQLLAQRQEFADLLGWSPEQTNLALAPAELALVELPEMAAAYEVALSNRLDYAQVLQEVKDAGRQRQIVRRSIWPDIRLTTAYELAGEGASSSDAFDLDDDTWFAGLTVGSDLNQTREEADIAIAGTEVELARISQRDTEFRISRQLRDRLAACRRSRAEYEISKRNAKIAHDRLRLAQRLYELDRGNNFDVVEAQDEFVVTELKKHESRAAVSTASFRLLHAMGHLVNHPDHLKPGAGHEDGT